MGMRLEISRGVLAGIRRDAAAAHPLEACGLLFGNERRIDAFQTTENVADDPHTGFEIDPAALFQALRAERAAGAKIIGYWHSHPNGDVEPSARDLEAAQDDGKLWVIVAGDDIAAWQVEVSELYDTPQFAGIQIIDGESVEVVNYVSSGATIKTFAHRPMATGEVRHLVPRDKCDEELVPLIAAAGYPAIAPILDSLMDWTADLNWPIAWPLAKYLATLGEPILEPVRRVLRGNDNGHKWTCVWAMIPEFPVELQVMLQHELQTLAEETGENDWGFEVGAQARSILATLDNAGA
jgi:proteasome lid subunit RPN8/RPN11